MSELVLEISSFFIALFCFGDCLKNRKNLYLPLPKTWPERLRNQHFVYLALLTTLMISAISSAAEVITEKYLLIGSALLLSVLNQAYFLFHTILAFLFPLYVLNMTGAGREKGRNFLLVFLAPFFLAELLVIINPFTKFLFYVDQNLTYQRGDGMWILYGIASAYILLGVVFFAAYKNRLTKMDRSATLILISIAVLGICIQGFFAITVELFFEAVGFLGFMLLLEDHRIKNREGKRSLISRNFILVISLIFITVITINILLIYHVGTDQTEQIGAIQVENIKGSLQETLSDAEENLLRFSMGMEQKFSDRANFGQIEAYIREQKQYIYDLTGGNCYNVYAASSKFTIIPDFDMPEHYHAVERVWYLGAKQAKGTIYISAPYVDAATGDLCFTLSYLLSDGDTVTAMDFNLTQVQDVVRLMSNDVDQMAMIITEDGTIVGCSDPKHQGADLEEIFPEYRDVFERVKASKEHGSFTTKIGNEQRIVFSNVTSNGWYLILSVNSGAFYEAIYKQMVMLTVIDLLMVAVIVVFYMVSVNNQEKAEEALVITENFISNLPEKLNQPLNKIVNACEGTLRDREESPEDTLRIVREEGKRLRETMDNLFSYANILKNESESGGYGQRGKKRADSISSKYIRLGIIGILMAALLTGLILSIGTATRWGQTRISKEADKYNSELTKWMLQQQSILRMFTDVIAADPSVLDDYDSAVKWLNDIGQNYSEMSFCYMANPYAEHAVIMNNGWVPEPDYHVEEREWYIQTERSGDGYSISAPYFDAQTGLYCITFSRIVYSKEGEFLGIFAIDCFIDKLIDVLDDSYGADGYAFLVDQDGTIINHPDKQYEMTVASSKNVEDTEYADAYHRGSVFGMWDYDGQFVSCYVEKSELSGFTVVVIQNWWSIYGTVLLIALVFLIMLVISIVSVAKMISRFISWQEETNEKLVVAAKEAVSAGKAKSRFLAQMSHEIRTPINAVLGMNEMILRESKDDSIKEYSENIQSAGKTLLSLINSILDFSKIEEGRMEIIPVRYDTQAMLENVIRSIDGRAREKGLIFESHVDENLPVALYGDDMRISQVVMNLLTNAVKYTREGRVDLYVDGSRKDEETLCLRFRVADTGIGIKEEDRARLFESFTRLEEARNRNIEGTGLGMAIVSRLLGMMGSALEVKSEYGKGSEFSFTVEQTIVDPSPIGEVRQSVKTEMEREEVIYAPDARILAVDDNEMNLKVIRNLLKLSSIVPDLADSGEAALEKLRTRHYDLVLLDHMMPQMDGIETLKKAKEEGLIGGATTVIALTANAVVGARESYLKAGFDDYLSKPVEISALERALKKYLPESRIRESSENGDDEIFEFFPENETEEKAGESGGRTRAFPEVRRDLEAMGIKVSDGLNHCGGEEDFYLELLTDYVNAVPEKKKELGDALRDKDFATYGIKVHALKGVAKTIGDGVVFKEALALEMAAKEGRTEEIADGHPRLMRTLEEITDGIAKILT